MVPARPFIFSAAPSLTLDPGLGLPSASTGHCDDRRRAFHPARVHQRLVAHGCWVGPGRGVSLSAGPFSICSEGKRAERAMIHH